MDQLETLFRTHSLRLTNPRREVFSILEKTSTPLFIQNIIEAAKDSDRTSIYRTLELFSRLGIVQVIPTGWKQRYELSDLFRAHHHHLQCTNCQEIISIDTPELERTIHTIAKGYGYELSSHHIELHGLCNKCQS